MIVQTNVDLQPLTTLRTRGAVAHNFYRANSLDEMLQLASSVMLPTSDWLILGGGSNLLVTRAVDHVVQLNINHRRIIEESDRDVVIELGAGNSWHDCVEWAVANGWAGIEAMALIPGTVGAAPIQNIGAYGQQFSDVCLWVEGIEVPAGVLRRLERDECQFGYRDSIFKHQLRNRFLVTSVGLRLEKRRHTTVAYAELARAMEHVATPTIEDVFSHVIALRRSKLPPDDVGSAGSFFKNPVVPSQIATALLEKFPSMPHYPANGATKLSAGWLIEHCGFKGVRRGDAGVYDRHALVLVNYGNAHAADILRLAGEIKDAVRDRFGVELEEEVVIV